VHDDGHMMNTVTDQEEVRSDSSQCVL